jgi:pyruvate dehydrogenase E2 component (dihydrolipoamide acetyltransferase)
VAAQADVRALDDYRARLNGEAGFARLTVTPFIIAAVGRALAARPTLNRLWRDEGLVSLCDVAVGVAVDTHAGVRMPVISGAHVRSLDAIALALTDVAQRARTGGLRQDDMRPAAISVSNVGMLGVTSLAPIIDPEQSHVLGVGAPQSLFRPDHTGAPVAVREITLTLACDHRLTDGMAGAEFLRAIVEVIESPTQLRRRETDT